jgi:hypothetical protein
MSDPQPAEMPIRISFELTPDDLHEATSGQPPGARSSWKGCLGWLVFALVAAGCVAVAAWYGPGADPDDVVYAERPMYRLLLLALGAPIAFALFLSFALLRSSFGPQVVPWKPLPGVASDGRRKQTRKGNLIAVGLGLGVFALVILINQSSGDDRPRNYLPLYADRNVYLPLLAWAIVVFPTLAVSLMIQRRAVRRAWDAQVHLRGQQVLEVSTNGVILTTPTSRSQFQWSHFAGFKETTNLVLLYPSTLLFHMIPKRGFAGEADFVRFCGLLQNGVREGMFLPRSSHFAVLVNTSTTPTATPPPDDETPKR